MRILKRSGWLVALLAWELGSGDSRRLGAQEVVLPESVRTALGRFAHLKTSFSVSWSHHLRAGAITREKLKLSVVDPPEFAHEVCYLVWQGGNMYWRRNEGGHEWEDAPNSRRYERAFDGRVFMAGSPDQMLKGKPTYPGILIEPAEKLKQKEELFPVQSFEHLGIRLPRSTRDLLEVKPPSSQLLYLLEQGGRLLSVEPAQIDGRPTMRIAILAENPLWKAVQQENYVELERLLRSLQTMNEKQIQEQLVLSKQIKELTPRELQHVYYLDPAIGYAVRRYQEMTHDGRLLRQSACTEHRQLGGYEIWLPGKCETDNYASGNYPGQIFDNPFWTDVFEASEFGTKPVSDERFTLKYTVPGTHVTDRTLGVGDVSYIIPAKAEDLEGVIADARAVAEAKAQSARWEKIRKAGLVIAATVALMALLVYLVKLYRRKLAKV